VSRIRTERQLRALPASRQETRLRAAEAVHEMRKHSQISLAEAARRHGTSPGSVRRYFGHLLRQDDRGGRYHVTRSDREPFLMNVVDPRGRMVEKVVRGSGARQQNLAHHRALARFAGPDGGDTALLAPFVGKRIAGVDLLTDPDMIERLFDAGELDFLEYQSF
jgi:AcrR family transcriptional regulator